MWKDIFAEVLDVIMDSYSISNNDCNQACGGGDVSKIRKWRTGASLPLLKTLKLLLVFIKDKVEGDDSISPLTTKTSILEILKKHNCESAFNELTDLSPSQFIVKCLNNCYVNNKNKMSFAQAEGNAYVNVQLRKIHFTDNDDVLVGIRKAENSIFACGSGMHHIYKLMDKGFFNDISPNVEITIAVPAKDDVALLSHLWRSNEEWNFRRTTFEKGVLEINKVREKKVNIITLSSFFQTSYIAVDYKEESTASFIGVGHYLLSSEIEKVERYSFIIRPEDGEVYWDYHKQIDIIENHGNDLLGRYGESADKYRSSSYKLFLDSVFKGKNSYYYDLSDGITKKEFERILNVGQYHVYFPPINKAVKESLDTDTVIPYGIIKFTNVNNICNVNFELIVSSKNSSKHDDKQYYEGFMVISSERRCAYCWLYEREAMRQSSYELLFFSFTVPSYGSSSVLKCALAEAVSTSAVDNLPAAHRMFLCKYELEKDFVLQNIAPFLQLNTSKIYIKEDDIKDILKEHPSLHDFLEEIKPIYIYEFDDDWADISGRIKSLNEILLLKDIRSKSIGFWANKVSRKVDGVLEYIVDNRDELK